MITRNSARCVHCLEEIVSTHRHDFVVHVCKVKPTNPTMPLEQTYNFFVDGGNEYLRRGGNLDEMIDTSESDWYGVSYDTTSESDRRVASDACSPAI